jgi:hypothetical protein
MQLQIRKAACAAFSPITPGPEQYLDFSRRNFPYMVSQIQSGGNSILDTRGITVDRYSHLYPLYTVRCGHVTEDSFCQVPLG